MTIYWRGVFMSPMVSCKRRLKFVFRYPLWGLFLVVTVSAVTTHCEATRYRRATAVKRIRGEDGARVYFAWMLDEKGRFTGRLEDDNWSHRHFGHVNVRAIIYQRPPADQARFEDLLLFPELEWLYLGGSGIGDTKIEFLACSGRLRRIRALGLSYTGITDESLKYLDRFPALEELVLTGTKVSDNGVLSLRKLKSLREVWLLETHLRPATIDSLEEDSEIIFHCAGPVR